MRDLLYLDKKWTFYSYLIIAFLFLLLLLRWPLLPNFLDIYYHLSVAQGFAKAGGFSAHDFWSYAPAGRPHLYPPLFHFLILVFLKSGLSAIFIARLLDIVTFPLFLVVILLFMRQLFNLQLAFFAVLISSSLYSFYLASSNFLPLTFAFMFGLLSLWALKKHKIISASIFLSLCFYTHAQTPWFFILTYILYGLLDRANLMRCLKTVFFGILLSLPIIIYLLANLKSYHPGLAYENFILELNLYILLALLGLKKVFKEKSGYYLLLSLGISVFAFVFSYPYRYISGQGLLGWVLLSSIGLQRIYESAQASLTRIKQKNIEATFIIALIILFLLISPALIFKGDKKVKLDIFNSTYINLVSLEKSAERPNDYSISSSRFIDELIKIVRKSSQNGDIIFANLNFAGTMISSLSDRADAFGMVREVVPKGKGDPILNAHLIIWFKDYKDSLDKNLTAAVGKYNLEKISETDIAYIYRNNFAKSKEQVSKANIPNVIILAIFLLTACLLVWDLVRNRNNC
jgi:hypothetical protein